MVTEFTPIKLNGQDWIYNTGGNESTQILTFRATGIPEATLGLIVSGNPADGIGNMRRINEGETFTRAELDQLHFIAAQGVEALGGDDRFSSFSFEVTDNGDAKVVDRRPISKHQHLGQRGRSAGRKTKQSSMTLQGPMSPRNTLMNSMKPVLKSPARVD